MGKQEKRIEQLLKNPNALTYDEIESLFRNENFEIQRWKWSHKHIYHKKSKEFAVVPIHNWDCKPYYKDQLKRFYLATTD